MRKYQKRNTELTKMERLEIMDNRRASKNNKEKYKELNSEIKIKCQETKKA